MPVEPGRLGLGTRAAIGPAIMAVIEVVSTPGPPSWGFWKGSGSLEMSDSGWGSSWSKQADPSKPGGVHILGLTCPFAFTYRA